MHPPEEPARDGQTHDQASTAAAFDEFLASHPDALIAAMSSDARLVPVPSSVELRGHRVYPGRTAMEAFVAGDRVIVAEAWTRAQTEPVVEVMVHLEADPMYRSTLRFFDVRSEHGLHVIALLTRSPSLLLGYEDTSATPRLVAHVRRNATAEFLEIDDATTTLLGWTEDELIGRPTLDFVHPDDAEQAIEGWLAMRGAGTDDVRSNVRLRRKDGTYLWLEVTNNNHLDDPEVGCVLSRMVDISEHMAALEALHGREQLLHRLAEALPVGICHLRPDGQVMHTNPPMVALLGPVDSVDALVDSVAADDRPLVRLAVEAAMRGEPVDLEVGVPRGFEERRCDLTLRTMGGDDDDGISGLVVCATDVTDRTRLRAELEHRATHDALSGCLNRAATVAALERAMLQYPRVAVAYIDLDHFKAVNDKLGHAAGDELLRVTAQRLHHVIRSEDRLGRIGGDEFVVICPQSSTEYDVPDLARRLSDAVSGDVSVARRVVPLHASVGAALSVEGETDAEALLGRADAAMYEHKRSVRQPGLRVVPPAEHA